MKPRGAPQSVSSKIQDWRICDDLGVHADSCYLAKMGMETKPCCRVFFRARFFFEILMNKNQVDILRTDYHFADIHLVVSCAVQDDCCHGLLRET